MGLDTGRDCKAYVDDTGAASAGTWDEIEEARDVSRSESNNTAESQRRGSVHVKQLATGQVTSVSFSFERDRSSAVYDRIRAAYKARTPTGFAFMDGAIATSGTKGMQLDALVTTFNENEPLDDVATVDVELAPHADGALDPTDVTVA
jgi:translation elongation factor P/translation initiation factor 5A